MSTIIHNYLSSLVCIVVLLLVGCDQKKEITNQERTAENDSILNWIEKSYSVAFSPEDQEYWLNRAVEAADRHPVDSTKLKYYSQISLRNLRKKDSLGFRETSATIMKLASAIGDSTALAEAHWDLAAFNKQHFVMDSAYYHYGKAYNIYNAINDDFFKGRMLLNMAMLQADIKDYAGGEIRLINAIRLLKPLKADDQLFKCYNLLASISQELGEHQRALDYYDQAGVYANNLESAYYSVHVLDNNKGNVFKSQGLHDIAIPLYVRALKVEKLPPSSYARTLANLAESRFKNGDTADVKLQLMASLKIRDSVGDLEGLALNHYLLADYYLITGDTSKALHHGKEAIDNSKKSDNNKRLLEAYLLLSRIDSENAMAYSDAYVKLNDSLLLQERKLRDKFARIQFETDEFIAENVLLAKQRQLWIGIAAGVFLLAIAILIIINQRVKNQKLRFEQQQQSANQEIFDLMLTTSQKVEEGKHDEQKRISEELHDGVLGQMNGVRMVLLGLNKKSDDAAISMRSQAIEKLQEVQEEIRTISHELSDAAYQKFHNFMISIRELVENIRVASQIECEFTYDHDMEWDDLSGEIKINLYRIIQEGLQNCVKYSDASLINLNFDADETNIIVLLEDNGVGFDAKKVKKGIGHKNINSRVSKINGSWELESNPGQGTKIVIKVPVVRSAHHTSKQEDQMMKEEIIE
ncbi:MAG: sensor histidine kinase [Flavobacteriaceae bacterium]